MYIRWNRLAVLPKADSERKKKKIRLSIVYQTSRNRLSRATSWAIQRECTVGHLQHLPRRSNVGNVDPAIRLDFISRGVRDREKNYLRRFVSGIYCARRPVHHDRMVDAMVDVAFVAMSLADCEAALLRNIEEMTGTFTRAEILVVVLQSILRNVYPVE